MWKKIRLFLLMTIFFFDYLDVLGGTVDTILWPNANLAIHTGIKQFIEIKSNYCSKYAVYVIKIISLKKNKGEFSISYILKDESYKRTNASHYLIVDNRLFLFRTDTLEKNLTEKTNIPIITDKIRQMAFDILAGPNMLVTSQSPDIMVFQYKRKKVTGKLYTPLVPRDKKYYFENNER